MKRYLLLLLVILLGCSDTDKQRISNDDTYSDFCSTEGKRECHGNCLDGFEERCYFDQNLYKREDLEYGTSLPEETKDACFAIFSYSECYRCYTKFEVRQDGVLKKVSCKEFSQALEEKNRQCGDCLGIISAGCC